MAFLFSQQPKSIKQGFTLIELMIVVVIMAILFTLVAFSVREMVERGRKARAQGDMSTIAKAIRQLELDTNESFNGTSVSDCTSPFSVSEITVDGAGGLITGTGFSNWKGPYIEEIPEDSWRNTYQYVVGYACNTRVRGCEDLGSNDVPVKALVSEGSDHTMVADTHDATSNFDNVVLILCK